MRSDHSCSHVIVPIETETAIQRLRVQQKWYIRSLIGDLQKLSARDCIGTEFTLTHPNGTVGVLVEVVPPFLIISDVFAGAVSKDN